MVMRGISKAGGEVGRFECAFDGELFLFDSVIPFAPKSVGTDEKNDDEGECREQGDAGQGGDAGFAFGPLGDMNHGADRMGGDRSAFEPAVEIFGEEAGGIVAIVGIEFEATEADGSEFRINVGESLLLVLLQ